MLGPGQLVPVLLLGSLIAPVGWIRLRGTLSGHGIVVVTETAGCSNRFPA